LINAAIIAAVIAKYVNTNEQFLLCQSNKTPAINTRTLRARLLLN